ncbi:MAG: DUF4286 family protein [Proteobacteria bacterium]|nr:DUF4286 family protein [Pseudomonadota bacterium]
MTTRQGPIYEVTFFVDRDVVDDHDRWLEDHVRKSLRLAGIADCRVFSLPDNDDEHARRICQHVLETDEALDEFLDGAGADIDTEIAAHFGEHVAISARVLREDNTHQTPLDETPNCLNCSARLRGQYCGHCGQRARGRLISLWELIADAFGDLLEIDSRIWQTLIPLMIRPGRLTHDYLKGRRARYMPPFRMYLVMSVIFFVVAFFDPREELSLFFEPQPSEVTEVESDATDADEANVNEAIIDAERTRQEIFDELAKSGIIVGDRTAPDGIIGEAGPITIRIDGDDDATDEDCSVDASDLEDLPDWLARRLTPERLQQVCERVQVDDGRSLMDKVLGNIPAALIILLPLMALILKALYPLSRRYYVEHLLFFVHFHAFFFLILTLQILFARLAGLLGVPENAVALTIVAVSVYVPLYLFIAMRRVYGQSRFVTFLKYIVLTVTYGAGFLLTMIGALAIAAFSI